MSNLQKVNKMTAALIRAMTDAELEALASQGQHDMSKFTDAELDAIINGTASPDLTHRITITRETSE
jgi:pyruvate dehydrogenase complex dehydrogenase (E1) component